MRKEVEYRDDVQYKYDVKKNTILGLGLRNAIYQDKNIVNIDNLVANLVVKLNNIDKTRTLSSCGGHENKNSCYVSFHMGNAYAVDRMCMLLIKYRDEINDIPHYKDSVKIEMLMPNKDSGSYKFYYVLRLDGAILTRKMRSGILEYLAKEL